MVSTITTRAYDAHTGVNHGRQNLIPMKAASRSRTHAVRAATILMPERASVFDDSVNWDVETFGGVPKPPQTPTFSNNDWPLEGSIVYGVAKTPIDRVNNAEFCDPLLGHAKEDILSNAFVRGLKFDTTTELCAVALQRIAAAVTGQLPEGSPAKATESLNYFLFVEKVINLTHEEFLGPQALSLVIQMMSYLAFSATVSNVLRRQHASLAKKARESFSDSCAFEPFGVDVDMIANITEAHARASNHLCLGAGPSGATFSRRQLQLLQPMGEGSVSASHASRLLVAWSILEGRFEGFTPSNQQVAFLANTFRVGIDSSSWGELEALAGAMAGFKFVPASTSLPLLKAICEEAIGRFAGGNGTAADAGAVLAVAKHTALSLPRDTAAEEVNQKVNSLLVEHGISPFEDF